MIVMMMVLTIAAQEPPAPAEPVAPAEEQYAPMDPPQMPEIPGTVEEAFGVEDASLWRKVGLAGAVTGGALLALSVASFTFGLDTERELRAEPHARADVDSLLLRRDVFAAIAWPSLVLGVIGVGAGITMLVLDDASEEVAQ